MKPAMPNFTVGRRFRHKFPVENFFPNFIKSVEKQRPTNEEKNY